jgi:hypothetical protein
MALQWQRAPIEILPEAFALALFCAFVISLLVTRSLDDGPLIAIALLLIGAAFYANRNVAVAVIAVSIPFAHHIGCAIQKYFHASYYRHAVAPRATVLAALALVLAITGGLFSNQLPTWEKVPRRAVDFMKARGLYGNILNNFDWGEYLIWHVQPQSRVFVDGRYELVYPDSVLGEYLAFLYAWPGGEKLLERYPHDFVLAKLGTGAYHVALRDAHWDLIYRDSISALFARSKTADSQTATRPGGRPEVALPPVTPDGAGSLFP